MHAQKMRSRTGEALTARLVQGMHSLEADVVEVQGEQVSLFVPGRSPVTVPVGAQPTLYLRVGGGQPVPFSARLVRRSDEDRGVRFVVRLTRPWEVQDKLSRLLQDFFGRRQHVRVAPHPRHGVQVVVRTETPLTADRVLDLSEGGLAFTIQAGFEPRDLMVEVLPLQIRTRLAGPWQVQARVRGRWVVGDHELGYGVQFLAPSMTLQVGMRAIVRDQSGRG